MHSPSNTANYMGSLHGLFYRHIDSRVYLGQEQGAEILVEEDTRHVGGELEGCCQHQLS